MAYHLVILKKPMLDAILAGRKKIESRFYRTNRPAMGKVSRGDVVFLKQSSGPILAKAKIGQVESFYDLEPYKLREIKRQYNDLILGPAQYWQSKRGSRFGFLAWLVGISAIEPISIEKQDRRGWVVLNAGSDFGLLNLQTHPFLQSI